MTGPLEDEYFSWLCDQVLRVRVPTPSLRYDRLFRILHNTEFAWKILGDDNRAADGVELRSKFLQYQNLPDDPVWLNLGCSIFEMFIALSARAEFVTDNVTVEQWFWTILQNLGLDQYSDAFVFCDEDVEEILYRLIWRQYDYDGRGGMFPLQNPRQDQTQVEIWYQFFAYLEEQEGL